MSNLAPSISPTPRPEVLATPGATHGALDYVELFRLGLSADDVIDFSVNSNPFGPSPAVLAALSSVPLERYPDRDALALRAALSRHLAVASDGIIVGNGTAELIHLVCFAFLQPGDHVVMVGPTFGEYERAARLMGAHVNHWTAQERDAFAVDGDAVQRLVKEVKPRLAFLCRPNNPTGSMLPLDAIRSWADACPQTLLVVDEAYLAFALGARSALSLQRANVLALRSMTKDYALAGLRLGYAVGDQAVIEAIARVRPAWNVNALAQAAGVASLGDQEHLSRTLGALRQAHSGLASGLRNLGLTPLPTSVHYFLMRTEGGRVFRERLLQRGVMVRDCASFGLPAFVRIATRRPEQNDRLLAAIKEVSS